MTPVASEASTLFPDFDGVLHPVPVWLLQNGSVDLARDDAVELDIDARVAGRALFDSVGGARCRARRTRCANRAVDQMGARAASTTPAPVRPCVRQQRPAGCSAPFGKPELWTPTGEHRGAFPLAADRALHASAPAHALFGDHQ
jgi:hypothetical protein